MCDKNFDNVRVPVSQRMMPKAQLLLHLDDYNSKVQRTEYWMVSTPVDFLCRIVDDAGHKRNLFLVCKYDLSYF